MNKSFSSLACLCLFGAVRVASSAESVLYDHTANVASASFSGTDELGEVIILEQASALTKFGIVMRVSGAAPKTDDLNIRFYSTTTSDPNSALPGSLISSLTVEDVLFSVDQELYEFDVPDIKVPQAFFFTVETANDTSTWKYFRTFQSSIDIGLNGRTFRENGSAGWLALGLGNDLGVRFEGVPIPEPLGSMPIVALTFALISTPRGFRHLHQRKPVRPSGSDDA
jgi:hypothetical protein